MVNVVLVKVEMVGATWVVTIYVLSSTRHTLPNYQLLIYYLELWMKSKIKNSKSIFKQSFAKPHITNNQYVNT